MHCHPVPTALLAGLSLAAVAHAQTRLPFGEQPAVPFHTDQSDIDSGRLRFRELFDRGGLLFAARFNTLDGAGRPGATGNGTPSARVIGSAPARIRTSGPDADSCAGCHNQPEVGGAGDFVANVFVLAQVRDPITESVGAQFSNERNTLGMHGAGPIEMLAREMTAELIAQRTDGVTRARSTNQDVTVELRAKGVRFGSLVAHADGTVDTAGVVGVNTDLIVRPFHQKGVVVSLREFSNNAMNHHHGMESVERFGVARTGSDDFDGDGVRDELSVGDITAVSVWQAALQTPGRLIPRDPVRRAAMNAGERLFEQIGCASCHVPAMELDSPLYTEPNPYNPAGNLRPQDVARPFAFDMTREGPSPRLERTRHGKAIVRAYTDLKRHVICDAQDPFFLNERLVQGGVALDQFLTRKLWDCGNTAPYGHRGDLSTITEAILHHAGEARPQRDAFARLSREEQQAIVEFLKSLVILPAGSERVELEGEHERGRR